MTDKEIVEYYDDENIKYEFLTKVMDIKLELSKERLENKIIEKENEEWYNCIAIVTLCAIGIPLLCLFCFLSFSFFFAEGLYCGIFDSYICTFLNYFLPFLSIFTLIIAIINLCNK